MAKTNNVFIPADDQPAMERLSEEEGKVPMKARTAMCFGVLACAVLSFSTGCAVVVTDPEYAQKLATVRTDCTGREIIGVWVSQLVIGDRVFKKTLLLRPDGTGLAREAVSYSDTKALRNLTWKYAGDGIWQIEVPSQYGAAPTMMTIRFNGRELLEDIPVGGPGHLNSVFVRAEDEAAVDQYLRTRPSR